MCNVQKFAACDVYRLWPHITYRISYTSIVQRALVYASKLYAWPNHLVEMAFARYNYRAACFFCCCRYSKWIIIQKVLRPNWCLHSHTILCNQMIYFTCMYSKTWNWPDWRIQHTERERERQSKQKWIMSMKLSASAALYMRTFHKNDFQLQAHAHLFHFTYYKVYQTKC